MVIGFWSNLEDEIRRNGCGLDVRMTTETHNVRVHCAGIKTTKKSSMNGKWPEQEARSECGEAWSIDSGWT